MNLTEKTTTILKNFASINQSIVVRAGNVLTTVNHPSRTLFAHATLDQSFPTDFAIYDLSKFLSALSLLNQPTLNFSDKFVDITDDSSSIRYNFAEPSMLGKFPLDPIVLNSKEVFIDLQSKDFTAAIKALSILQVEDIAFVGDGKFVKLVACTTQSTNQNVKSDEFSTVVGQSEHIFKIVFKIESIKMLPLDYKVTISKSMIAQFDNAEHNISYWVAVERNKSNFEEISE